MHQLSDSFLSEQPLFGSIADELIEFIGDAELSFYNRNFDMSFLQSEFDKYGYDIVFSRDYKSSCLMKDFADKENYGKWLKLDDACVRYGIDISERKTHGAAIDALLAAELYIKLHKTDEQPLKKTPQRKSQAQPTAFPIPRAYKVESSGESVQLNFCKNPNCNNYGVPAKNPGKSGDGKIRRGLGNDYKFTTTKIGRVLTCKLCGTSTKLINNKAHFLESNRNKETLERPITTATNGKRWNGYACYNPKWAVMLIEILRVYNNYVLTDEKSLKNKGLSSTPRTPAQKIGFADQKYRIEDILDFTLISKAIAQR